MTAVVAAEVNAVGLSWQRLQLTNSAARDEVGTFGIGQDGEGLRLGRGLQVWQRHEEGV